MFQRKNKFILKIFISGFVVIVGFVYFFECRPMNRTLGEYLSHYMKGEYNLTHEVIELQYLSKEDKYLYIAGHDDCICDYETKKSVFEASNEEFIMDFVTNETCLFYLDDSNMVHQCTGDGKEIAKFQIKELDAKISLLYANEEDIYVMIGKKIYIYSMMSRNVKGIIEGYDAMGDDVDFERCIVDGEYLLLLSNNYTCSDYDGSVFREGTVGDYKNAKIVVINLPKKNILKEYKIMEGEVVYMDVSKYACVKDGEILFYDYTGALIEKHSIRGYEMPSVNKCLNYYFAHYDNELQIFLDDNLIDTLDVSKNSNTRCAMNQYEEAKEHLGRTSFEKKSLQR